MDSIWHYPRPDLVAHYLKILQSGVSSHLALIAPRRKGKTAFLLQDLVPAARKRNFIPVYASLWQNTSAPHEGIEQALKETLSSLSEGNLLTKLLRAKIRKTSISNDILGRMEVEFADNPMPATATEITRLDALLSELQKKAKKKTVLLLIDEVQHLATSEKFDPLTHALRTMLDKRQGKVKAIFTGSSRHYMYLLFHESQSPFYHFVEPVPFPDMDEGFVDFIQRTLQKRFQITTSRKALWSAFVAVDHSPYWMMKMVSYMITFATTLPNARHHVEAMMEATENFGEVARSLKPLDKLVFIELCEHGNPFSKQFMAKVDAQTDV